MDTMAMSKRKRCSSMS